jgi:hypothetical protein
MLTIHPHKATINILLFIITVAFINSIILTIGMAADIMVATAPCDLCNPRATCAAHRVVPASDPRVAHAQPVCYPGVNLVRPSWCNLGGVTLVNLGVTLV